MHGSIASGVIALWDSRSLFFLDEIDRISVEWLVVNLFPTSLPRESA